MDTRAAGRHPLAVLLPGTGSDEVFVRAAFADPLAALDIPLLAPPPVPGPDVLTHHRAALDWSAAAGRPLLVGGVSLGAHVAVEWALGRRGQGVVGLLVALPAWTGPPAGAPAALAAQASAGAVRAGGVVPALAAVRAAGPGWLADELARSWRGQAAGLAETLEAAAAASAPTLRQLRGLDVPAGVVGLRDDPVHPLAIARGWADALPRAHLVTSALEAVGRDRASLGRAAVLGWLRAAHRR